MKITIDEIQKILSARDKRSSTSSYDNDDGFFEVCFEKNGPINRFVDDGYKNAVLSVGTDYGSALILFNDFGYLKSIEIT
ncbi:hypothetical protein KQ944_07545 [Bacillus subtilis]|uniref:hypothetical protein n=1 Tax=Pseudochrobactrum asaccharolyticum TaxID=354351 RepID=UPI001F3365EC|nr:hypothetical protein [Pseudochrobactrum asaccharolyticum]MCF7645091.1 hypothetical protein [Pseudochrobactrum asaccharolyticum]MCF7671478.1 hypothetical protein [Bacillus subtilis]